MFTDICAGDGPGELCSFVASRLIEPHSWLEHTGFDPRKDATCPHQLAEQPSRVTRRRTNTLDPTAESGSSRSSTSFAGERRVRRRSY